MALNCALHELENGAILLNEHHAQRVRRLKRSEQNLGSSDFRFEFLHTKSHVRQIADGAVHRAVGLESQILDPVWVPRRIGDPDLCRLYVHLGGLTIRRGNTYVIEDAHGFHI